MIRFFPHLIIVMMTSVTFVLGDQKPTKVEIIQKQIVYKTTPAQNPADPPVTLSLHLFEMKDHDRSLKRPAIVFFFGGGWVGGSPSQFYPHCDHFARKGMVAIAAEYRIRSKHKTSPYECVADGKSAIRWVRAHAKKLGIDPDRIVAVGGSAGGHVAVCTALIAGFDEKTDDHKISSQPNALMLFNPVIDTTEKGYGAKRFAPDKTTELSPVHHVRKKLPPTIIFHGTADTTVPFENVQRFQKLMTENKNQCTLIPYKDKKHGFFNYKRDPDNASYKSTLKHADDFLSKIKFTTAAKK